MSTNTIRIGDTVEVVASGNVDERWWGTRINVHFLPNATTSLISGPLIHSPRATGLVRSSYATGTRLYFYPHQVRVIAGGFARWYKEHS